METTIKTRLSDSHTNSNTNSDLIFFSTALVSIAAGYSITFMPEEKIMRLTAEDGFYENTGAIFFLLTAALFFFGFLRSKEQDYFLFHHVSRNYSMLALSIMFFIIFGEEISWGQRILNFDPGNFFISNNMQRETNIHNLRIFHALDEDQSKKEWWQYFSLNRLFRLFWLIWCIVIPIAEKMSSRIPGLRKTAGIPYVSISFGSMFLVNYAMLKILETSVSTMTEVVEIEECITAVLFFLLALRLVTEKRNDQLPHTAKASTPVLSENSNGERAKPRTD